MKITANLADQSASGQVQRTAHAGMQVLTINELSQQKLVSLGCQVMPSYIKIGAFAQAGWLHLTCNKSSKLDRLEPNACVFGAKQQRCCCCC